MVYVGILAVVYFVEMLAAYVFFSKAGEKKYKNIICIIIGYGLFLTALLVNVLGGNIVWLNILYFTLMNILFGCLCFRINWKKAIVYSIILVTVSIVWEHIFEYIISVLTHTPVRTYLVDNTILFINVVFGKGSYFISAYVMSRFIIIGKQIKIPFLFYCYPFAVLIALTVFWYVCLYCNISPIGQIAMMIVSLILLIPTLFLFMTYQKNVKRENELLTLKSEKEKAETEKTYYSIIEKQNENLKTYADDAQKHLEAIRNLNSDPQIEEYINKMTERLIEYSKDTNGK